MWGNTSSEHCHCGVGLRIGTTDGRLHSVCTRHLYSAGPGCYGRELLREKNWFVPWMTHLWTKLRYSRNFPFIFFPVIFEEIVLAFKNNYYNVKSSHIVKSQGNRYFWKACEHLAVEWESKQALGVIVHLVWLCQTYQFNFCHSCITVCDYIDVVPECYSLASCTCKCP